MHRILCGYQIKKFTIEIASFFQSNNLFKSYEIPTKGENSI